MPAISTLSLAVGVPGSNTFTSETLNFTAEAPPSWFELTLVGIDIGPDPDVATYEYTVTPTAPPGVYTIELTPGLEYITITITGVADTDLTICVGGSGSYYLVGSSGDVPWVEVGTWPDNIWIADEPLYDVTIQAVGLEAQDVYVTLGTYVEDVLTDIWIVHLVVTQCGLTSSECGDNTANIEWYNLAGGRNSYIFKKMKSLGVETGESTTFKDSNRVKKYGSRDNVRDSVMVISGYLPSSHLDLLKRLKSSIQAYEYNTLTGLWDIPIVIEQGDFEWKEVGSGLYKYDFKYSYGNEITIQHQ